MATSLKATSEQPSYPGYSSIDTPRARILSHDKNSRSESVSLSFKNLDEVRQFLDTYESAFSGFATLKQSRWVGKPLVLISLKTRADLSPSVVDITDALTNIFANITFLKSAPPEVSLPTCPSELPTPEIGLVRMSDLSLKPDVAYLYFKVRGCAPQFLASHADKFVKFATATSVRRSNTTVRIALKPDLPGVTIKDITDVLKRIFPSAKILE